MKHSIFRLTALILALSLALPAAAEKQNVTDLVNVEVGPGETRLVEVGDITVPERKSGIWATTVNGHGIISAGNILSTDSGGVNMDATGGSFVVSCGNVDHVTDGRIRFLFSLFRRTGGQRLSCLFMIPAFPFRAKHGILSVFRI